MDWTLYVAEPQLMEDVGYYVRYQNRETYTERQRDREKERERLKLRAFCSRKPETLRNAENGQGINGP